MIGFTDILSAGVVSLALLAPASARSLAGYGKTWDAPAAPLNQLESARLPQGQQRLEFLEDGANPFKFNFAEVGNKIDNEAVLQLQVGRGANTFLATLAPKGLTQFLTVLKPCGILLPHVHQRSNEFYSILSGTMNAGISQENGGAQDIVFDVYPGEVFVVPQGLLHFNHNQQCEPLAFFQSFDSNDPGALNVIGALAALGGANDNGAAAIAASNASEVKASPQGAFALDQQCLKRCHLPESGAPGDGLDGLSHELRALFGL